MPLVNQISYVSRSSMPLVNQNTYVSRSSMPLLNQNGYVSRNSISLHTQIATCRLHKHLTQCNDIKISVYFLNAKFNI